MILSYYVIDLVSPLTALRAFTFLTVDGRRIYSFNRGAQSFKWHVGVVGGNCSCATKALCERTCKKFSYSLSYFNSSLSCVTSVFGQFVGKCSVHYILTLHAYRAYSFRYITLGFETIFLAFSRFGLRVPRDGAEVQGM